MCQGFDRDSRCDRAERWWPWAAGSLLLANASRYGLSGSVWARHGRKAERLGRRLLAGVITINDHRVSHGMAETPWGGFKTSGLGRIQGCSPQRRKAGGEREATGCKRVQFDVRP